MAPPQAAGTPSAQAMVTAGKALLAAGKAEDALRVFAVACAEYPEDPQPVFALAGVHLKQGRKDVAALYFLSASQLAAACGNQLLSETARDNALLLSSAILPRDTLAALSCPATSDIWSHALTAIASSLSRSPGVALCVSGVGKEALQLAALLQERPDNQDSDTESSVARVISCHTDALTASIAQQLAVANELDDLVVVTPWEGVSDCVIECLQASTASPISEANCGQVEGTVTQPQPQQPQQSIPAQQPEGGVQGAAKGTQQPSERPVVHILCPTVCQAALQLKQLRALIDLALKSLPQDLTTPLYPVLCPSRVRLRAMLVESQELVDMNEVRLDDMREDTGLDYAPCNELLWRPYRPMSVDTLSYRPLSHPCDILTLDTASLMQGGNSHSTALSKRPRYIDIPVCAEGQLDCVVVWTEYQLIEGGDWLSYGPQLQTPGVGGDEATRHRTSSQAVLRPHIWQRVHYLTQRHKVHPSQRASFAVTLSHGDTLRIELDEDSLLVTHTPHSDPTHHTTNTTTTHPATNGQQDKGHALQYNGRVNDNKNSGSGNNSMGGLPAGEPLHRGSNGDMGTLPVGEPVHSNSESDSDMGDLPAGEPLNSVDTDSESNTDTHSPHADSQGVCEGVGSGSGKQREVHRGPASESDKGEATAGAQTILAYHLCMLNDRKRTRAYRDGIRGAVRACKEAASGQQSGSSQPLWVLDVGAGTGLLSLMAAQAGAPAVIGIERELPLAMTASALATANNLDSNVRCLQLQCNQLTVATPTTATPAAHPHPQPPQPPDSQHPQHNSEKTSDSQGPGPYTGTTGTGVMESILVPSTEGKGAVSVVCPPALVVHEIFGSDPLSEHILTTMRHVKANLCGPNTRFMPSRFRVIAALAHTEQLWAARCGTQHITLGNAHMGPNSGAVGMSLDVTPVSEWASHRVECNALSVSDLYLHTHPIPVADFDLSTPTPLPLQGATTVQLPRCAPTHVTHYAAHNTTHPLAHPPATSAPHSDGTARSRDTAAPASAPATGAAPATAPATGVAGGPNCAVYWFEADCGEGGWLSTGPGYCHYGHWSQCFDFDAVTKARHGQTDGQDQAVSEKSESVSGPVTEKSEATVSEKSESVCVSVSWSVDRIRIRTV